jgi:hypothetical protein
MLNTLRTWPAGVNDDPRAFEEHVVSVIGVSPAARTVSTHLFGEVDIPLTTNFVDIRASSYRGSPRPVSLNRKLQNSFLARLSSAGVFATGRWLDAGGTRAYGDWLGFEKDRYDILNLPGVPDATIEGSWDDAASFTVTRKYDGLLTLNGLFLSRDYRIALANLFATLRSGAMVVLDFNSIPYWYTSSDGDHSVTFNPLVIAAEMQKYLKAYVIVPIGNLVCGAADYYARRLKSRPMSNLVHSVAATIARLDRSPRTALDYIAVGVTK